MIRVNCFFKANEGKYNDALEAAIALVAASQQDEGVVSYDCFESATRGEIFLEAAGMLKIEQFEF